jgi:hypothetical protein
MMLWAAYLSVGTDAGQRGFLASTVEVDGLSISGRSVALLCGRHFVSFGGVRTLIARGRIGLLILLAERNRGEHRTDRITAAEFFMFVLLFTGGVDAAWDLDVFELTAWTVNRISVGDQDGE